jgi:hypothetical protein
VSGTQFTAGVAALLTIMGALAITSMLQENNTADEATHMMAGYSYLRERHSGSMRWDRFAGQPTFHTCLPGGASSKIGRLQGAVIDTSRVVAPIQVTHESTGARVAEKERTAGTVLHNTKTPLTLVVLGRLPDDHR